jgi:hypothetical protein
VPLFGHPRYFDPERLLRYRHRVVVAMEISAPLMEAFADELEAGGWKVERLRMDDPNPASLVAAALPAVVTTYTFRLDADTVIGGDVAAAVAAAEIAGADLCSIKCAVANRTNIVTILQAPGEDIETGRAALALRMRIRHLDMVVHTDAPESWRALFRQRRLWWAGTFRHWWINVDRNLLHLPVLTSYYLLAIWLSWYFKWWTMMSPTGFVSSLPVVYAAYLFVTVTSNLQVISPWMIVFPFYALAQVLVMPVFGALTYFQLAGSRRCAGRYQFGYRRREALRVIRRVIAYPTGRS